MRPCTSHRAAASTRDTERLHTIAQLLLDEPDTTGTREPSTPVAIGIADDDGTLTLHLLDLHDTDPLTALTGFNAPRGWWAFGIVGSAQLHALEADAPPGGGRGQMVHLVARSGLSVTGLATVDGRAELVPAGREPVEGRIPDLCRRVLGLATPPPERDSGELFATWWLEAVVHLALDPATSPPTWPQIVDRYPGTDRVREADPELATDLADHVRELGDATRRAWPWSRLRQLCADGALLLEGVDATGARWMDDGCFARRALEPYPSTGELCDLLDELLPPSLARRLRQTLGAWGLGER